VAGKPIDGGKTQYAVGDISFILRTGVVRSTLRFPDEPMRLLFSKTCTDCAGFSPPRSAGNLCRYAKTDKKESESKAQPREVWNFDGGIYLKPTALPRKKPASA